LRWRNFSILSFSAYQGYDTNAGRQAMPIGSSLTALNALVIYSVENPHSRLNLQYHPFVWLGPKGTYQDWGSASADLSTTHNFSRQWNWTAGDTFHYSPSEQSTIEGQSFITDFGGGLNVATPFLATGLNVTTNNLDLSFEDRYGQYSSLSFHGYQGYVQVSDVGGSSIATSSRLSSPEELLTFGAGSTWTDRRGALDTLDVRVDYRRQNSLANTLGDGQYITAGLEWTHLISPTFRLTAEAGPGWHTSETGKPGGSGLATTVQGAVGLFKRFRKGGVALSFTRSNQFTGIVGNDFNDRLDLTFERHLTTRWSVTATGSYLEQAVAKGRSITGKFASAEVDYFVTRNWSLFSQGRYIGILNGGPMFAPDKIVTVGFRWAWVPDKS